MTGAIITQTPSSSGRLVDPDTQLKSTTAHKIDYAGKLSEDLTAYMNGGKEHWKALQRSLNKIEADPRFSGCLVMPTKEQWNTGKVEVKLPDDNPEQAVELIKLLSKGHSKNSQSSFFTMVSHFIATTGLASKINEDDFFNPLIKRGIIKGEQCSPQISKKGFIKKAKGELTDIASRAYSAVKQTQREAKQWVDAVNPKKDKPQESIASRKSSMSLADSGYLSSSLSSVEEIDQQAVEAERIKALQASYKQFQDLECQQQAVLQNILKLKPLYQLVSQKVSNDTNGSLPTLEQLAVDETVQNEDVFMRLSLEDAEQFVFKKERQLHQYQNYFEQTTSKLMQFNDQLLSKPLLRVLHQAESDALNRSGAAVYENHPTLAEKIDYVLHPQNKGFANTFSMRIKRALLPQSSNNQRQWSIIAETFLTVKGQIQSAKIHNTEENSYQAVAFDDQKIEQQLAELRAAKQNNDQNSVIALEADIQLRRKINRLLNKPAMDSLYFELTQARDAMDRYADTWINKVLPKRFKIETADYQAVKQWLKRMEAEHQTIKEWLTVPYQEIAKNAIELPAALVMQTRSTRGIDKVRYLFLDYNPKAIWQRLQRLVQPKQCLTQVDIQAYASRIALVQGTLSAYSHDPIGLYIHKAIMLEEMLSLQQAAFKYGEQFGIDVAKTAQYQLILEQLKPYRAYQAGL